MNWKIDIFIPHNYVSRNMNSRKVCLIQRMSFWTRFFYSAAGSEMRVPSLIWATLYSPATRPWASGIGGEKGLWGVSPAAHLYQTRVGRREHHQLGPLPWHLCSKPPARFDLECSALLAHWGCPGHVSLYRKAPPLLLWTPMGKLFGEKKMHILMWNSEARLTFSKEALILLNSCVL